MIKIKKTKLNEFIDFLMKEYSVYSHPHNAIKSPKEVFFPQAEVLFKYSKDGLKVPERNEKPFALWGIRNCDTRSLKMLDSVFGDAHQHPEKDYFKDPYWKQKYDNCLVFNLACNEPLSTCFCHWFDGSPFDKTGSDVFVVETDDDFIMEGVSEKGKKFLETYDKADNTDAKDTEKIENLKATADSYLAEKIDVKPIHDKLAKVWDEPIWEEISAKCINCGACTFVCPTCHCFDVDDEGKDGKGSRIRLWDSCMFQLFTKEASGHNPRGVAVQRVRQRIMHKYNYFQDNYNVHLCTGCGRCVSVCPVNLDIREVIKKVLEY